MKNVVNDYPVTIEFPCTSKLHMDILSFENRSGIPFNELCRRIMEKGLPALQRQWYDDNNVFNTITKSEKSDGECYIIATSLLLSRKFNNLGEI